MAHQEAVAAPHPVAVYRDASEWHVRQPDGRDQHCGSLLEAMAVAAELAWPRAWR